MRYKNSVKYLENLVRNFGQKTYSSLILNVIAFLEAIFLPIPVDPFIMILSTINKKKWFFYFLLSTSFSVLGACVSYQLGYFLWDYVQEFFLKYVINPENFEIVNLKFQQNAFFSIFLSAFTPLPYKVFALGAGIYKIPLHTFIIASLLGRGIRFGIIAYLCSRFGKPVYLWIRKNLSYLTLILGLLLTLIYILYKNIL